jgi:hypothetical protein
LTRNINCLLIYYLVDPLYRTCGEACGTGTNILGAKGCDDLKAYAGDE